MKSTSDTSKPSSGNSDSSPMGAGEMNKHPDHVSCAVRWPASQHGAAFHAHNLCSLTVSKFGVQQHRCGCSIGSGRRTATKEVHRNPFTKTPRAQHNATSTTGVGRIAGGVAKRHTWTGLQIVYVTYGKPVSPQKRPELGPPTRGCWCARQFDLHSPRKRSSGLSERAISRPFLRKNHRYPATHSQQTRPKNGAPMQARRAAKNKYASALDVRARTASFEKYVIAAGNGLLRLLRMHCFFHL